MKILLTVHQFLPDYSSGTEVLTYTTAKELRGMGHEVIIFTGYPASTPLADVDRFDSYEYDGFRVERFKHSYTPLGGQSNTTEAEYNSRFFAGYFKQYLDRERPDVVHFFHLARLSASAVQVCYEHGIPTILTPTDFWFICPTVQLRLPDNSMCCGPRWGGANCVRHVAQLNQPEPIKSRVQRMPDWLIAAGMVAIRNGVAKDKWYSPYVTALGNRHNYTTEQINRIDRVMVPTRLMESMLTKNGLAQHKIAFAPFGINLEPFQQSSGRIYKPPLQVGYIGTLYEHKGVHVLIEAVRSLGDVAAVELQVYGKEDEFPEYTASLKQLAANDPRIRFCGIFPNSDIGRVFSRLDVLVVPSVWYENTPLVIYSAQAAACPVIVSDLPGMTEPIQHEENGLAVRPGDSRDLAAAIRRLHDDPSLLARLSEQARKPRSSADYAQQMERAYREIVRRPAKSFETQISVS